MVNTPQLEKMRNTSCFSAGNLATLKEIMYESKIPAGTQIYWEDDPADKLYFLYEGRVRITKATEDGKKLIIYMHQEGDLFGQVDPVQESTHAFGAEVIEDATVGILQQKDLEVLLWQHGDLAVEFIRWMGLMQRLTQTKFRDLMLFGKPGALCSTLIRLGNTFGLAKGEHTLITKKLNNTELAEMIGTTRESVNRMLGDLKRKGAISYDKGHIVIEDMHYLRDVCHCENCPLEICRI